jgi:glycosidase
MKQFSLRTKLVTFLLLLLFTGYSSSSFAQNRVKKVVLQAFWWDYWNNNFRFGWSNYLTELAPRLRAMGIDAVWIPPSMKNGHPGSVGYAPFDMYDLGDKYQKGGDSLRTYTRSGTKDELLRLIAVLHANGIEVIEDMVLNHNSDAGSRTGAGGQDTEPSYSMATSNGYKNFRYVSYKTPSIDESQNDYWTRAGRWSKNYHNFHPNPSNPCTLGEICGDFWGPDIDYETANAFGQSSNIPTTGSVSVAGNLRAYFNPAQSSNYMRNQGRDYMSWFKRQTAVDGWRFDAVKHYSISASKDFITNTKYNLPSWAKGDTTMLSIGEWVGDAGALDYYVSQIAGGGPIANEEHTGTYDFALRGYSNSGGLHNLVYNLGSYNMQDIPGSQQGKRYYDYGSKRVHRSVPFVNNHDTYRPKLTPEGNFQSAPGDTQHELGGNGKHIDPREPRLAAAYAVVFAVDGNPALFFEDLFDIGTTGKRWTHLPTSTIDLPARGDLINLIQAHQKLSFKDGDYIVSTHKTVGAPVVNKGSLADHLVIERKGKAVIGITDAFSSTSTNVNDQEMWVSVDPSLANQNLYDYSGAHGLTPTQVFSDGRVLIKTAPVGHNIFGANGHGYSIWAPMPPGITFNSVAEMQAWLGSYTPPRNPVTTQEWEMADDLGDSHCMSLGQGGRIPDNVTNERIVGRIYVDAGKAVNYAGTPEVDGRNLTLSFSNAQGDMLHTISGVANIAAPLSGTFTPDYTGWLVAKIRNTSEGYAGQKAWVRLSYTAPMVVNTRQGAAVLPSNVSIWTGNKNSTSIADCGNWEGGAIPGPNSTVVIYGHAKPFPVITSNLVINRLKIEQGATFTVSPGVNLTVSSQ